MAFTAFTPIDKNEIQHFHLNHQDDPRQAVQPS
jgi:hypothetical protein